MKLLGADAVRRTLLKQANLCPGDRVLDIGCGTGTLGALIKCVHSEVSVVGLDLDPKALARAKKKTARAGASIPFYQGFSDELPYPDASFDRVFSSLIRPPQDLARKQKLESVSLISSRFGRLIYF